MPKSYVIIPAYNEGPNLGTVLDQLLELSATLPLGVIVVNDGSRDNTLEEAERFRGRIDLRDRYPPGQSRRAYDLLRWTGCGGQAG